MGRKDRVNSRRDVSCGIETIAHYLSLARKHTSNTLRNVQVVINTYSHSPKKFVLPLKGNVELTKTVFTLLYAY